MAKPIDIISSGFGDFLIQHGFSYRNYDTDNSCIFILACTHRQYEYISILIRSDCFEIAAIKVESIDRKHIELFTRMCSIPMCDPNAFEIIVDLLPRIGVYSELPKIPRRDLSIATRII